MFIGLFVLQCLKNHALRNDSNVACKAYQNRKTGLKDKIEDDLEYFLPLSLQLVYDKIGEREALMLILSSTSMQLVAR